jgi:thiol-disulfide isomerase/thioredoxin
MFSLSKIVPVFLLMLFVSKRQEAQIKYGQLAPEIALPALNGDTLRLTSLRGKVVLLDFWASWCGPCRVANKELARVYQKYKGKGFEIFSVSIDENKKAWAKAINKDKISWLQVNDDKGWDGKVPVAWNIYQIPTSYLIDKQGRLIAMDPEGKKLESLLKDLLN